VGGRAWLFGDGPLLRFTGRDFESIAVPGGKTASVAATPEGEIRVVTPAGVFAFGADEAWHAVPIPPFPSGAQIESLDRRAMGWLAWLRFEEYGHEQLLVDGLRGPPLVIEDPGAIVSPVAYVTPLDASCVEPFAMLYKVSRTAPRDYGYPATRAALAGQADLAGARFSEVEAFRDRYLIARFKGKRQRELLARLVARVRDKVQGSKPQLLCADKVPSPGLPTTREVDLR
jgi:hypothetical protein